MKKKKEVQFKPDDRVVLVRRDGDDEPEDFGASGFAIPSTIGRFGHRINDTFYYFGGIVEYPEWCVISTTTAVTDSTRHFAIRKENIKLVKDDH